MSTRPTRTKGGAYPRRGLTAVSLVIAVLTAMAGLGVAPAHADEPRRIVLNVPWANQPISGTAEVIFSVYDVGGPVLRSATVSVGDVSTTQPVAAEWCSIGCEITSTLDVGDLPDGPATIRVVLDLVDGGQQTAEFPTEIRNGPSVYAVYPLEAGLVAADDVADVRIWVEAHDGASISAARWTDGRGRVDFQPFDDPRDLSRPNWRALVPAGDLPEGPHTGTIIATDSQGRDSVPVPATFVVIRAIQLAPVSPWRSTVDDLALQQLDLQYRYPATVTNAYPVSAVVRVDGVTVAGDRDLERRDTTDADNAGIARLETAYRLPAGPHEVVIEVTDNRGLIRQLAYTVTVGLTVSATWTRGANATVTSGDLHRVTAHVTTSSVEVLDCRILIPDDRRNLPAICTRQPDGSWSADAEIQLSALGSHQVQLQITPSRGRPYLLATTLTVLPRAFAIVTQASAVADRPFTLVGEVRSNGPHFAGVVVDLQTRTSASAAWRTVATGTSGAIVSGVGSVVKIPVTLARSTEARLVPRPKAGVFGVAPGPTVYVRVGSTLVVTSKPTSVKKGRTFTVRGTTRPADTGAPVTLQRYLPANKTWITVVYGRATAGGAISMSFKPFATTTYRLSRNAVATSGGSTSAPFTVRLTA